VIGAELRKEMEKKYKVRLKGTETLTFSRTAWSVPVVVSAESEEEAIKKAEAHVDWEENTDDWDLDLNQNAGEFAVDDTEEADIEEVKEAEAAGA
jgi:hypothetical protein